MNNATFVDLNGKFFAVDSVKETSRLVDVEDGTRNPIKVFRLCCYAFTQLLA